MRWSLKTNFINNYGITPERLRYTLSACLIAVAGALLTTPVAGCGSGNEGGIASSNAKAGGSTETSSAYLTALREFRRAVATKATYDLYGYAEYLPPTQRAAIDAFCFTADQVLKNPDAEGLEDPASLAHRITQKAESDLKSERNIVAPGPTHKAIGRLRAALRLESLDRDLAKSYSKACY